MKRLSLRWLIVLPTLLTFTIGFGAFALYIDSVERANLLADIDDELVRAERGSTIGDLNRGGPATDGGGASTAPETGLDEVVDPPVQLRVSADGDVIASGGAADPFSGATLRELSTRSGTFTVDDPRLRVRVTPERDGTIAVTALPLDRLDESVGDFRRTLLGGGLVVLALVAGVVWLLITRSVRPVTRMAMTATRIAEGELQTEIDAPTGARETADLATALNDMVVELRSTIDDRERAAQSADEARDAMQRFLADMSHELRTPLTALKGYSDLHAGGMLDEPGALDRAMSRIGDESERLNGLVTDMLQLARDAPAVEASEQFDAIEVVAVVAEDLRAAHPSVDVELDVDPNARGELGGRAARLHQAILNVGSNACQHAAPKTTVRLVVRSTVTDLVIEVVDHGAGVDPGEAERIFLPFYRPETSRGRDGRGGAGLGLAIASRIVEQHHGTITVEPTPGGGATFVIAMPLAADEPSSPPQYAV